MDMDSSVVIAGVGVGVQRSICGLNGNEKNTIKISFLRNMGYINFVLLNKNSVTILLP